MYEVTSQEDLKSVLEKNKVVVVDYYAKWCGPCKHIAPVFIQLESDYPAIFFCKVDIDQVPVEDITSIPTFRQFVDGEMKEEMTGSNINTLREFVMKSAAFLN